MKASNFIEFRIDLGTSIKWSTWIKIIKEASERFSAQFLQQDVSWTVVWCSTDDEMYEICNWLTKKCKK